MKAKGCIYDMKFPHLLCSLSEMFSIFSTLYVLSLFSWCCLSRSFMYTMIIYNSLHNVLGTCKNYRHAALERNLN